MNTSRILVPPLIIAIALIIVIGITIWILTLVIGLLRRHIISRLLLHNLRLVLLLRHLILALETPIIVILHILVMGIWFIF